MDTKHKKIYFGCWNNLNDVEKSFHVNIDSNIRVLFAEYCEERHEGTSIVIFVHNKTLYEVNGSHCSCHGFEGQWEPQKTTAKAICSRKFVGLEYGDEAKFLVTAWEAQEMHKPLSPDVLVNALQDAIHLASGRLIGSKPICPNSRDKRCGLKKNHKCEHCGISTC